MTTSDLWLLNTIASNHCVEQSPGLSCGSSLMTMVCKVQGHSWLYSKHSLLQFLTFVVALTATLSSQESPFLENISAHVSCSLGDVISILEEGNQFSNRPELTIAMPLPSLISLSTFILHYTLISFHNHFRKNH